MPMSIRSTLRPGQGCPSPNLTYSSIFSSACLHSFFKCNAPISCKIHFCVHHAFTCTAAQVSRSSTNSMCLGPSESHLSFVLRVTNSERGKGGEGMTQDRSSDSMIAMGSCSPRDGAFTQEESISQLKDVMRFPYALFGPSPRLRATCFSQVTGHSCLLTRQIYTFDPEGDLGITSRLPPTSSHHHRAVHSSRPHTLRGQVVHVPPTNSARRRV